MNYRTLEIRIRGTNALDVAENIGYMSLFPEGSQLFALDQSHEITPEGHRIEGERGNYYRAMLWHRDTIKSWEDAGGWGEMGYTLEAEPDVKVSRVVDDVYKIEFNERVDPFIVKSLETEFVRKNMP